MEKVLEMVMVNVKITIATFQSGSVIITGARNIEQVNDAYNFINSVFENYYKVLKKQNAPLLDLEDTLGGSKPTKKNNELVFIKKIKFSPDFNKNIYIY